MARAVLFDLDGTLIDSIKLIVDAADYAYDARPGPRPTRDQWTALIGTPLDLMLKRWALDDADVTLLRAKYREFQLANHDRLVTIYPGVADTLRALRARGHKLAIVSSKLDSGIRRSMDFCGLTDLFSAIVGLDATATHKPHPEPVLHALELLGAEPAGAVYVGDSPHDMESGNAAGVVTIAATWGPYTRDQIAVGHPAYWIDEMVELPPLLARIDAIV